jgi:hypothetical protein
MTSSLSTSSNSNDGAIEGTEEEQALIHSTRIPFPPKNAEPAHIVPTPEPLPISDAVHEFISTGDASVFDRVTPWTASVVNEGTRLLSVHRQNVPFMKEERPWWDLFSLGKKSYNMYEELFRARNENTSC